MSERYAVYAVPPAASALERAAAEWLGRCARTDAPVHRPERLAARAAEIDAVVGSPRRYGFHGTLRAPIRLAHAATPHDLAAAVEAVAAGTAAFELPLAPGELAGFLALVPTSPSPPIEALHAEVLAATDPLRALPEAAELDRRRAAGLSAEEEALLARWGYPYVLSRFRFHMTLTERLDRATAARLRPLLEGHFAAALATPMMVDHLAIFREPAPGAPFCEIARFALAAPAAGADATATEADAR